MEEQKSIDKAAFITKASANYCDQFPLRASIQAIPWLGSSLDTMLAGLGARYQYQRLEHFISELNERLEQVEQAGILTYIQPSEELFDFTTQVFDQVIKTRSAQKRKRFANLVTNQAIKQCDWDEAETACRLLGQTEEMHVNLLCAILNVPVCDSPFSGLRVVTLSEKEIKKRQEYRKPTYLNKLLPNLTISELKMLCSELIAKGLLHDEGIGRLDASSMEFFVITDMGKWFLDWICETTEITKKK